MDPLRMEEGRKLLETRRAAMLELIQNDPQRALAQALSFAERERLPAEWSNLVEEKFSTLADLSIYPDCSPDAVGASHIILERPGQQVLRGLAWGELAGHSSKSNIPVEGIALDGWTAIRENGVRLLSGGELEAVQRQFPQAPGSELAKNAQAAALIGGKVHRFATAQAAGEIHGLYPKIAALPGPFSAEPLTAALAADTAPDPVRIFTKAKSTAGSWTETPKKILVINTIFPNRTTPVANRSTFQSVMAEVSDWIAGISYGKTNLVVTVPTNPFTLPNPTSFYEPTENFSQIMTDAKALALASGYNSANYDITVVAFPGLQWLWAGRASGGNMWLNGGVSVELLAHEFGHSYGLRHDSGWDANDGSIMPAAGTPNDEDPRHQEYGDRYSVMGLTYTYPLGDYSAFAKSRLNWIRTDQVHTVTTPGTYRISRFDTPTANLNSKLAMKLQRGSSQTFWVGYRTGFGSNYLNNGAYITWQSASDKARLLDMSPDSRTSNYLDDMGDAALALGRTFTDPTGSFFLTPIARGGTEPNEWMDLRVEFSNTGNRPPSAAINLPTQSPPVRTEIALTGAATDQDGDPLYYSWDLGDGHIVTGANASWRFNVGGSRDIKLRVADGKGGLAEVERSFFVNDPLTQIEEIPLQDPVTIVPSAGWLGGLQVFLPTANNSIATTDGVIWRQAPGEVPIEGLVHRVTTGAGRMVAVGGSYDFVARKWYARSAVTTDGSTWVKASHGTTLELKAVAYRNGLFVAVGLNGTVTTSPDGINWTPRTNPATTTLYDVTATAAGFVACGDGSTIITSTDGVSWTLRTVSRAIRDLRSVSANGQNVIAVSNRLENYLLSQDGGTSWKLKNFNIGLFEPEGIAQGVFKPNHVAYADGFWIATESMQTNTPTLQLRIALSTDGLRWELLPPQNLQSIANVKWLDGRIWIYGQIGKILRSGLVDPGNRAPTLTPSWPAAITARVPAALSATATDADGDTPEILWETQGPPYLFGSTASKTFLLGGTKTLTAWAADGRGGRTSSTRSFEVIDPLLYWNNITQSSFSTQMRKAACSDTRIVFMGEGDAADAPVAAAHDPGAWTRRNLPLYGYDICWRSPGFLVVGYSYDPVTSSVSASTCLSADGQNWGTPQNLAANFSLDAVAASDSAYVTVGQQGIIFRSTDGLAWNAVPSGVTTTLHDVGFVGERGLAVGDNNLLLSEDGGASWTPITAGAGSAIYASRVSAAGGRLYLSGSTGLLRIYQPDTRTWIDPSISGLASLADHSNLIIESVVLSGSTYVATGRIYDYTQTQQRRCLAVSMDGLVWEAAEVLWPADPTALVDCGGKLFATGPKMLLANGPSAPGLVVLPATLTKSRGSGETGLLGTIKIGNTGAGGLSWTSSSNVPWLAVTPASGNATLGGAAVNVTLQSPLPVGTHTGTLTFSAPGVPSQQATITVNSFLDDHGSNQAAATHLTLGTPLAGQIQNGEDSDWFTFDIDSPGAFKVWTTGSLNTYGELHDKNGLLFANDDSGGVNFQIERIVLPGRHWVKVRGTYASSSGSYTLHSSFTPAGPPFALKSWDIVSAGSQRRFTFSTAIGYRYYIERSPSLDTGWTQVGPPIIATEEESVITIPMEPAANQMFFRVGIMAP